MFGNQKMLMKCGLMGLGLAAATAQAALIPVFEYQFPASYNGSVNSVVDVSGAGNNATIPAGFTLALSSNIPTGEPVGTQSINFAATPGRITTSAIGLMRPQLSNRPA